MNTINTLVEQTGASRYYVTRAAKASGVSLKRGRKPTVFSKEDIKKIKRFLRILLMAKNI